MSQPTFLHFNATNSEALNAVTASMSTIVATALLATNSTHVNMYKINGCVVADTASMQR